MESFHNKYEVEYIIKHQFDPDNENKGISKKNPRNCKFMVKWKGYAHRHDSWVSFQNFTDEQFVMNYWNLSGKQKKKRLNQYNQAKKAEEKKAQQYQKIAGLTEEEIKKKCMANSETFKKGQELFVCNCLDTRNPIKKKTNISGIIHSLQSQQIQYRCSIKCDLDGKIKHGFACRCLFQQQNKQYLCKHLVCLLLDRCIRVSKKKKKKDNNNNNNNNH